MAAAWFNALANPGAARAISAGTQPGSRVHPVVVEAMNEVNIDLSANNPQKLTSELLQNAAFLITMGCGEECPVAPPGVKRLDWPLTDPKDQPLERVRVIRDEIRDKVRRFVDELGVLRP